jgi:nicotinamidase-related amidase
MGKERIDLLIIDPQVDFCDPKGALYVPGAENDMARLASMIDRFGSKIKNIHVTLDCHHLYDIAHPGFWRNSAGENPEPFTIITHKDIVDGVWFPAFAALPGYPNAREYVKSYTKTLEDSGRYPLCIWPPHCLIGSEGNAIMPDLFAALVKWEQENRNNVNYVSKGSTITTEHYSAVKAEVPDPNVPDTQLNTRFIQTITNADKILSAGEAGSHCYKNTVEDIADGFGNDDYIKKIVMLTDAVSPVISPFVDFPAIQAQFVTDMEARGMQTALTTDF